MRSSLQLQRSLVEKLKNCTDIDLRLIRSLIEAAAVTIRITGWTFACPCLQLICLLTSLRVQELKETEELDIQLKVFNENKEEDSIELSHRLEDIRAEMEYPFTVLYTCEFLDTSDEVLSLVLCGLQLLLCFHSVSASRGVFPRLEF